MRVLECCLPRQSTGESGEIVGWVALQYRYSSVEMEFKQWKLESNLLEWLLIPVLGEILCPDNEALHYLATIGITVLKAVRWILESAKKTMNLDSVPSPLH